MSIKTLHASGWLPYGSDDSSVVIQDPLTSELSAADLGFDSVGTGGGAATSNIVYDSVLGMQPNGASLRFQNFADGNDVIDGGWQISLEVQKEWLCAVNAPAGSEGETLPAAEAVLGFIPSTTAGQWWLGYNITKAITGRQFGQVVVDNNWYTNDSGELAVVTSLNKSDFITIRFGYFPGTVGGKFCICVDDLIVAWEATNAVIAGFLRNFYLGSGNGSQFMSAYYIRNLQIAARAPMFPVKPKMRSIVEIGDSFAYELAMNTGSPMYDSRPAHSCIRVLAKNGHYVKRYKVLRNAGEKIGDYTGASGDGFLDAAGLAEIEAESPDIVIIRGGTNDITAGDFVISEVTTSLTAAVDSILAFSESPHIILPNIPSSIGYTALNTALAKTNRELLHTLYQDIAENRCNVHYEDAWSYLGGDSPALHTFVGVETGAYDNLHPSGGGAYLMGKQYAESIMSNILK